jgi:hypothetical protein
MTPELPDTNVPANDDDSRVFDALQLAYYELSNILDLNQTFANPEVNAGETYPEHTWDRPLGLTVYATP